MRTGAWGRNLTLCGALIAGGPAAEAAEEQGWLGVYTRAAEALPAIEAQAGGEAMLEGATAGVTVSAVFPHSPADEGGLLEGDIIIGLFGEPFTCPRDSVQNRFRRTLREQAPGTRCGVRIIRDRLTREVRRNGEAPAPPIQRAFWREPGPMVDSLASGEVLEARATKQQEVLVLDIVLGTRPEARWPAPRSNDEIYAPERFAPSPLRELCWALADEHGVRDETEDLLQRLADCHRGCDPFRLECMMYVHRDPFRLESVSRSIAASYAEARGGRDLIARAAEQWVAGFQSTLPPSRRLPPLPLPRSDEGSREAVAPLLEQVTAVLAEARQWHQRAFAALSVEERRFLTRDAWQLTEAFAEGIYIHFDENVDRFIANQRLLEIAARIEYGALIEAALRLSLLADPEWIAAAERLVRAAYADTLESELLLAEESAFGKILIGGTSRRWYRELDAAFILDLGGDDVYTGNNGGSNGWDLPLAICIDLAGDDAYESTLRSCQGSGCFGIGALIDCDGADTYIAREWCQGTGYGGIGWLDDRHGDDVYRGRTYCQGVGLFGLGLLIDSGGCDRYEGDLHVQACGLPKGIGVLADRTGDDEYYAKGLQPTNYGDAGIFDAWSQGCGMGFRTLASGGLGVLLDGRGSDRMEAGNFSQGGGYYYGYGILQAGDRQDDTYIGSRYNQGFGAHQAVGVFLEAGGDDFYTTRQGVAQGLAWDECVTYFEDAGGNDTYQGGTFFSLGASAHNSVCIFLDRKGRDTYDYRSGPARAGGNSYHGGTSLSLFVDEGGSRDRYSAEGFGNGEVRHAPEHGFFIDRGGRSRQR